MLAKTGQYKEKMEVQKSGLVEKVQGSLSKVWPKRIFIRLLGVRLLDN